jgi:hypothetical protein
MFWSTTPPVGQSERWGGGGGGPPPPPPPPPSPLPMGEYSFPMDERPVRRTWMVRSILCC